MQCMFKEIFNVIFTWTYNKQLQIKKNVGNHKFYHVIYLHLGSENCLEANSNGKDLIFSDQFAFNILKILYFNTVLREGCKFCGLNQCKGQSSQFFLFWSMADIAVIPRSIHTKQKLAQSLWSSLSAYRVCLIIFLLKCSKW